MMRNRALEIPSIRPRIFRILYPKCLSICLKAVLIRFFNMSGVKVGYQKNKNRLAED
jgi:hypothetical protein